MAQPSGYLLNHVRNIGVFSVFETSWYKNETEKEKENEKHNENEKQNEKEHQFPPQAGAAPSSYTALVALGLSLALWCGVPSLLTPFPLDSLPLLTP